MFFRFLQTRSKVSSTFCHILKKLLMGFFFITGIFFLIFSVNVAQKNHQEIETAYSIKLETYDRMLSEDLSLIRNALLNLIADDAIVQRVMNPQNMEYDSLFACMSTLQRQIEQTSYLEDIVLYPYDSPVVYSEKYGITALSAYPDQELLKTYLAQRQIPYRKDQVYWLSIQEIEDRYFYICNFFYSETHILGLLMAEISPDLFSDNTDSIPLEHEYLAVFSEETLLYAMPNWDANNTRFQSRELPLFHLRLQCTYPPLIYIRKTILALVQMVPIFIQILIVAVFCASIMTKFVYTPFGNLVKNVREKDSTEELADDEYQYLYDVIKAGRQYETILKSYAPQILENMCIQLLCSGGADQPGVSEKMDLLKGQYEEKPFHLFLFHFFKKDLSELTAVESELIFFSLQSASSSISSGACILISRLGHFLFLYQPCENIPVEKLLDDLISHAAAKNNLHYEVTDICEIQRLEDLWQAHQKLEQQLNKHLYYLHSYISDSEHDAELPQYSQIDDAISHCWKLAEEDGSYAAVQALAQAADTIDGQPLPEGKKKIVCAHFCSAIQEYFINHNVNIDTLVDAGKTLLTDFGNQKQRQIYLQIIKNMLDNQVGKKGSLAVSRMQEIVAAEYANGNLSLNMIAEQLGMNQAYLSTLFTRWQGEGFVDYLNRYRVEKAKSLLELTDSLIRDVGYKVGFNSVQNFNRVFKKQTGMTPQQYRQLPKEEDPKL
ncbi:MAG: helix-turn-helix transcriptional regulator [Oscillibacter sp.]|nr:helix-turn-helix transcriptional regulator [Oscillibacter sp.]